MLESEVNRREFVFDLAGIAASAWLATHLPELRGTAAEVREFDAISAQIVPTDETPGAREAHVVRFGDRYFATVFKGAQPTFRNDFKLLADAVAEKTPGNRSFAALSDADQLAFLTTFEKTNPTSFS